MNASFTHHFYRYNTHTHTHTHAHKHTHTHTVCKTVGWCVIAKRMVVMKDGPGCTSWEDVRASRKSRLRMGEDGKEEE